MEEFDKVPEPEHEGNPEILAALFVLAWLSVVRSVKQLANLPQSPTPTQLVKVQTKVLTEVTTTFQKLRVESNREVVSLITDAYKSGLAYTHMALSNNDPVIEAKGGVTFSSHKQSKLDKMIADTQADLLQATHNTENNIKRLVRTSVAKEMSSTNGRNIKVSNMAYNIEKTLREQFLKNGIANADVAIIDRANRKWRLTTYAAMVARTKMNNAYMEAVRDEALEDGADLGIISTKPDTKDACLHFEGMIISLNGVTAGYYSYTDLKKSKLVFHPNCGHFVRPVASLDWVPKVHLDTHEKRMKEYDKIKSTTKQIAGREQRAVR